MTPKISIAKSKSIEKSDYVILGIPTDLGARSQRKGRVESPKRIRELSEDWFIPLRGKIDESNVFDMGDLGLSSNDIIKNIDTIKNSTKDIFNKNKTLISLGGDCSIKYGILSGLNEVKKNISVVYIDSHPDLVISKIPYYGSVMADCMKLRNIDFPRSVFVGIREIEEQELKLVKEKKIKYFTPLDIKESSIDAIFKKIKKITHGNTVYISLDIDSIDPAFAPAVGCIVPCGLSSTEILLLIEKLKTLKPIGLDITEYVPKYNVNEITGKTNFHIIS